MVEIQKFVAKLSDKEKKIFYAALLFVLLAFFDRLFLGPVWDKLKTIDSEIDEQQVSIKRDVRFLTYKDKIINQSKVFDHYLNVKPQEEDVINTELFSVIERFANQASINLIKSNPSESKKGKDFTQYFANLDCAGKLENVVSFMHAINSSDELLKIVKFNLTPKRGSPNEINASMTIVKLLANSDPLGKTAKP